MTADARWLPDATKIVDLGGGDSKWIPSYGDTDIFWTQYEGSIGIIDTEYTYVSRTGTVNRSAFIMDGTGWLKMPTVLSNWPAFTIAMVVMLHATVSNSYILGTDSDTPLILAQEADDLSLYIGMNLGSLEDASKVGKMLTKSLANISDRPVIIVLSTDGTNGAIVVVDHVPHSWTFQHPVMPADACSLYLGTGSGAGIMKAELFDVAMWNSTLTSEQLWDVANKLDSVYGVTR